MKKNVLEIKHIEDYVKCPNFAKYNWVNDSETRNDFYKPIRNILLSCYRDMSNLEKKVVWKTVRNRVHSELAGLLNTRTLEQYQKDAVHVIQSLRTWYLNYYRSGPELALHDLALQELVPGVGVSIKATVDALLLEPGNITLVEVTNRFSSGEEAYNSIGLRAKVWLLSKQRVMVNKMLVINIKGKDLQIYTLKLTEPKDIVYRTERALSLIVGGIKYNVFYPSITDMCNRCPYKPICAW